MQRARSEDDIPTLPAFAVGLAMSDVAMNDVVPSDEELASWWAAQRRRELSHYVVAALVVCFVIMAATAAQLG